jgi:hypothetical protein
MLIGIDVAKAQLEFACRPTGETGTVMNHESGISHLVARPSGARDGPACRLHFRVRRQPARSYAWRM